MCSSMCFEFVKKERICNVAVVVLWKLNRQNQSSLLLLAVKEMIFLIIRVSMLDCKEKYTYIDAYSKDTGITTNLHRGPYKTWK